MTNDVIKFSDEMLKRYGVGFMLCPRCQEQSCFLPVVEIDAAGIYISAIQCVGPHCEGEDGSTFDVIRGYVRGVDL